MSESVPPPESEVTLTSVVGREFKKASLLDYLCARFRYQDRAAWEALIAEGRLTVNGQKALPQRRLLAREGRQRTPRSSPGP